MKFRILILISAVIIFSSLCTYSQNINQPNVSGPAGLSVNPFSGNMFYQRTDLMIPCRGLSIDLTFYYNSASTINDYGYGKGWSMNYAMLWKRDSNKIIIARGDARKDIYTFNGSGYTPPIGIFDSLTEQQPGKFLLRAITGTKYFFEDSTHKRMTRMSDPNNNGMTFSYSGNRLTTIIDPSGRTVQLNYSADLHLIDITDPNSSPPRHITFENDSAGNPIRVTDPLGNSIQYEYDIKSHMTKLIDQASNQFVISYMYHTIDTAFVIHVSSPLNSLHFSYDRPTLTTTVTEMVNGVLQSTSYKYDSLDNIREKTGNCCGYHEIYDYDAQNNMKHKTDARGNTWSYDYDSKGNMTKETDPIPNSMFYSYDPIFSRVTSMTNKRGYTTTYNYDANGNRIQENKPFGGITEHWTYDAVGNMLSHTDGRGLTINYEYNIRGYLTKTTFSDASINTYTYDNVGNRKTLTDGNGHTTTYNYDLLNRLTKITDALGDMTTYTYDSRGNIISMTDIYGNLTTYAYDALNRRTGITNPAGTSTFTYDERGNMLSKSNNNGFVTSYLYNTQNLLATESDPLGHSRMFLYDANGNLISETDFNGHLTTYMYDQLNRMTKKTDPLSQTTEYGYDENGNLTSIKDAKSQITSFMYDALDRLIKETYADGTMKTYTYDAADNIITRTDQNGNVTNYGYDLRNRLTLRDYPGGNDDHFTYDNEFNILTANNSNANITYTYDNVNRVKSENMNGKTTSYSYNIPGRKRTITYPGGRSIEEDYDNRMRLSAIKEGANIASYTYDAGDRVLTRTYSNGVVCNYAYNNNDWVTNLSHKKAADTVANFIYTFDNNGNRLTAKKTHHLSNSEQYLYYNDYQLSDYKEGTLVGNHIPAPITQTHYNYDPVGNRTTVVKDAATTTYIASSVNAYMSIINGGTTLPTYDANGNTLTDGIHIYTYDFENRLLTIDAGATATYKYDAFGRRIQKVTSAGTINFYYDNKRIIEERDGSDVVQATYVYGTWIDDIINMRRAGSDYFYAQNSLGSVAAVTDNTGGVAERYEYDAYGKPTIYDGSYVLRTATAIGNTYMFTGREFDAESDNFHYRARFYKTDWGRFGQWDPIDHAGADVNLFRYVGNNPSNSTDPNGLKFCTKWVVGDLDISKHISTINLKKEEIFGGFKITETILEVTTVKTTYTRSCCDAYRRWDESRTIINVEKRTRTETYNVYNLFLNELSKNSNATRL